jgi:organic hydroperoxide reductase OsmC/OhrA
MSEVEYTFPVDVSWTGGRLTRVRAQGKPDLSVAAPPIFPGGVPGVWSPEDLLAAAAATCYAVTLAAIAEHRSLPLHKLELRSEGRLGRREDGRFGFRDVGLRVEIVTDPGCEDAMRGAAKRAEEQCLVGMALQVPVRATIEVGAEPLAA